MGTGRPFSSNSIAVIAVLMVIVILQHLQNEANINRDSGRLGYATSGRVSKGVVAEYNELVQKLMKHQQSFKITNDNNQNRYVGLSRIWKEFGYTKGAEVGVWKGDFSKYMLENMPDLTSYILVDSWRHLDNWNKPWVSHFLAYFFSWLSYD